MLQVTFQQDENLKSILNKEIRMEDFGGKQFFSFMIPESIITYQKRMLAESGCPYILPMQFLKEYDNEIAFYAFSGCIQIESYLEKIQRKKSENGEELRLITFALDSLYDIITCVRGLEEYLIFPESYRINTDLIFIDSASGKALLAFYPTQEPAGPLLVRILELVEHLTEICCDPETETYMVQLKEFIREHNPGLDSILGMVGAMQRTVSCIYREKKEPRNIEKSQYTNQDLREHVTDSAGMDQINQESVVLSVKSRLPISKRTIKAAVTQIIVVAALGTAILSLEPNFEKLLGLIILLGGCDVLFLRYFLQK